MTRKYTRRAPVATAAEEGTPAVNENLIAAMNRITALEAQLRDKDTALNIITFQMGIIRQACGMNVTA